MHDPSPDAAHHSWRKGVATFATTWESAWHGDASSRIEGRSEYAGVLPEGLPYAVAAILAPPYLSDSGSLGDTADHRCCARRAGTRDQ